MPSLYPNESMNGAWIEVFKAGVHTDSSGNTQNWTPEKIDIYLAKYNPANHEAPLRIDHVEPAQRRWSGPAFGWIEAAKRVGDIVYVKLAQVSKQFEEWVRQGFIKKRSISFDDQKGIHHLAFLGYNCPSVPGMENIYSDGVRCIVIEEFSENIITDEKPLDQKTTKIVGAMEAIDILGQKAAEILAVDGAKGTSITHQEAVMKAVNLLNYNEVPATNGQRFSITCDCVAFAEDIKDKQDVITAHGGQNYLARRAMEFVESEKTKGNDITITGAVHRLMQW